TSGSSSDRTALDGMASARLHTRRSARVFAIFGRCAASPAHVCGQHCADSVKRPPEGFTTVAVAMYERSPSTALMTLSGLLLRPLMTRWPGHSLSGSRHESTCTCG